MTEFPKPKFDVAEEDIGDVTRILAASGEIHVSTAPLLSEHLTAALAANRTQLVLDFSEVEFIDSTGLSVLLNALRRLARRQGSLVLVCTNPTVLRLFEITRLDTTFDILSTRAEALAHLAPDDERQAARSDAGAP
jgi:anti-sigma B factor antagonist